MSEFSILSARHIFPVPAQSVVIELENVFVDCLDASVFTPQLKETNNYRFDKHNNVLIICGLSIFQVVRCMQIFGKDIDRFEKIVVYVFDAFLSEKIKTKSKWKSKISRFYRIIKKIDYIFIPFSESVSEFKEHLLLDSYYMPMASDTLRFGSFNTDRPIHVNGYGRQKTSHSEIFSKYFNKNDYGIYHHTDHFSISKINDFEIHREYFWNLLRKSKIALAYDPLVVNPIQKFTFSFVGQRWYESLSVGCVILGARPTSDDTDKLLYWENSTLEIPSKADDALMFVKTLLKDEDKIRKISFCNSIESLKSNDWRYRIRDMIRVLDIQQPVNLKGELLFLEKRINDMSKLD